MTITSAPSSCKAWRTLSNAGRCLGMGRAGKVATKSLLLPVLLPGGEECERCADRLKTRILETPGVRAVEVDRAAGQVVVTYDASVVGPDEIERAAVAAGAAIVAHIHHETLVLRGMDCPDCAVKVERVVSGLPGVLEAAVSFAASRLVVGYDSRQTSQAAIVRAVRSLGYQVEEAQGPIQSGSLQLSGLDCADCVRKVERAVAALPGARSATVALATGRLEVRYDPAVLSLDRVARTVREVGYEARVEGSPVHEPQAPAFWEKNSRLLLTALRRRTGAGLLARAFGAAAALWQGLLIAAILLGASTWSAAPTLPCARASPPTSTS